MSKLSRNGWTKNRAFYTAMVVGATSFGCREHAEVTLRASSPDPVIGAIAEPARPIEDDGQWRMAPKDHANLRYSKLSDINTDNVAAMAVAWSFSTGVLRGHEAAPLVVGSTMYLVTPFPNFLYALDLSQRGAPVLWKYDPRASPSSQGVACCDVVNRGAAYDDGRVYYNTLDGQTIAVDAAKGKEVWRTSLADIRKGETMTMAPIVVHGKVIVGNSGGEMGARGWIAALDAGSGQVVWRAYSTGPDGDVLIGPTFRPFYAQYRGKDLGVQAWPPEKWKTGGGNVWGWLSYDRDLGVRADRDPWSAEGLEWTTTSPPPPYDFLLLPTVRSRYPLWTGALQAPLITGLPDDSRQVLVTRLVDAEPDHRLPLPGPTVLPALVALGTGVTFIGLIFTPWAVPIGLVLTAAPLIVWFWPKPPHHELLEEEQR
jgi:PQQ-like domain